MYIESIAGSYVDDAGRSYLTLDQAAPLLGLRRGDQVLHRARRDGNLSIVATDRLRRVPRPGEGSRGRPPKHAVQADEVIREHNRENLDDSGTNEAVSPEIDRLTHQLDALRGENLRLTGRVASLEEALRLSLIIDSARVEQLRQFLAPTSPND
jgi:hypothetical protein